MNSKVFTVVNFIFKSLLVFCDAVPLMQKFYDAHEVIIKAASNLLILIMPCYFLWFQKLPASSIDISPSTQQPIRKSHI
ncbi:CLUMA_CG000390, isoform A [Clunio marinus]|uniref:CLUMA_CG000390, isoform A n=1 Tax=Clunio marinus TaxID=568069 RepID=A0A1J1HEN9_9DIPT|nr:CLUMA_CG000390, isoform A [Clunio marinus]